MAAKFQLTRRRVKTALDKLAVESESVSAALEQVGYPPERRNEPGFTTLARIVIGQQVSVAAAASIAARVAALLGGAIEAAPLEQASDDALRSAGLSRQKVSYLRALAHAVNAGDLDIDALPSMSDEAAIAAITQVKGFGVWSAHMYLMFSLGRPDIWPAGDLAVRGGFARIMGLEDRPTEKMVSAAGEAFSPHRSSLALLCWRYYSEAPL